MRCDIECGSSRSWLAAGAVVVVSGAMLVTTGCSSKKYVRSQVAPVVQQTNDLDAKTAEDHRTITDTDERTQRVRVRTVPTGRRRMRTTVWTA